jgi:hypothetical protein
MTRTKFLALVLGWVVAVGLFAAGSASADSRGYQVRNYTAHTLKLDDVKSVAKGRGTYDLEFEGRPRSGSTITPGGVDDWELKWAFGGGYAAHLIYTVLGDRDARVNVTITTSTFSNDSTCRVTGLAGSFCIAEGLRISLRKGEPRCLRPAADGVDWSGCDMQHRGLERAKLAGADLRGTNLSHAFLRGADLRRANLRGGSLERADLLDIEFVGTNLIDTNLDRITVDRGIPADGASCRRAWELTPGVDYDNGFLSVATKEQGRQLWACYWPKGT